MKQLTKWQFFYILWYTGKYAS